MAGASAISIGAFDGVHLGHQALIRAARSAVGDGGRVLVLAFEPHPLRLIRPREVPGRLSGFPQRRRWLMETGADDVVALEPTTELLSRSPRDFLDWLCTEHAPGLIVEGADFRFGRGRAGSVETLQQHERIYGYRTVVVGDVETALGDHSRVRVASSLIRWLVGHGRVRDAALLLGRPYELECEVVHGDGRGGSALGVATANLDHGKYLLPADGIYTGTATDPNGVVYPAAVSVGTKPTFGKHPRVCEAHLVDFDGRAHEYGWKIKLEIHDWLRDQIAFDNAELLIEQIHRDIARVKREAGASARRPGVGVAGT
ncbi:MAG: bifunctional riboflavin kinase/FMN adenylyltransferase [Planctomycetota bacterium]|jgi:riboflavin kinase/FMN adenylyltransferase